MIKTGFYYSTYIGLVQANDGTIFKYFTRRYWVLFIHSLLLIISSSTDQDNYMRSTVLCHVSTCVYSVIGLLF